MIHFHGTPITPRAVLYTLAGRHFCISHAAPADIQVCQQIGQSLMLDNGAFSAWRRGKQPDWPAYYGWCEQWLGPADWAVIPDVIDGDDAANDALIGEWPHGFKGAPVWHLHEPLDRLRRLTAAWPRVCLGSSGGYSAIGTDQWERRMDQVFNAVCGGRFVPQLHGLRMMSCSGQRWPLASVDSTDIAQNHSRKHNRATWMADRWDAAQCPAKWHARPVDVSLFGEVA